MLGLRQKPSLFWTKRCGDLARWANQRLMNREDRWVQFLAPRKQTPEKLVKQVKGKLRRDMMSTHFLGEHPTDLIGLHSTSEDGNCKWFGIEITRQGEDDPTGPGDNFHAALAWYETLTELGVTPLLLETGSTGQYTLVVLFDEPAPAHQVATFVDNFVSDFGGKGLFRRPRTFPDLALFADDGVDDWMRLPGQSPFEKHHTKAWDGEQWCEGGEAIDLLINAPINNAHFLSRTAVQDNNSLAESAPLPLDVPIQPWPTAPTEKPKPASASIQEPEQLQEINMDTDEAHDDAAIDVLADQMSEAVDTVAEQVEEMTGIIEEGIDLVALVPAETIDESEYHDVAGTNTSGTNDDKSGSDTDDIQAIDSAPVEPVERVHTKDDIDDSDLDVSATCHTLDESFDVKDEQLIDDDQLPPTHYETAFDVVQTDENIVTGETEMQTASLESEIRIPEAAQAVLSDVTAQTGMREDEIVKRLFQWLDEQNEVVRAVVLGQIPEAIRPDVWKLIAEKENN